MPYRTTARQSTGSEPPSGFEAKRQKTIDALTQAFASDVISVEEYESRVERAAAANAPTDLEALILDLPAEEDGRSFRGRADTHRRPSPQHVDFHPQPAHGSRAYPARSWEGGSVSVSCVMGDRRMTGNWLDSDRVNSYTVMGSTRLDLRDADLPESGPVRIEAFVLMGETVVVVPRDLPVRLSATPFIGEAVARRDVNQNVRGARCWVEVSGLVVMGSVVVKAAD